MKKPNEKQILYKNAALEAYNNSIELLKEAEILFNSSKYARSYALSIFGLEEFAKSFMFKCMSFDIIKDRDFHSDIRKHREKMFHAIHIVAAFYELVRLNHIIEYSRKIDEKEPDHSKHVFPKLVKIKKEPTDKIVKMLKNAHNKRLYAIYVDLKNNKVITPQKVVNEDGAKDLLVLLGSVIPGFDVILEEGKEKFQETISLLDPQIFSGTMKSDFTKFKN
ncbi:MAG: AbiV family abortive infection protein [Thaumarchaeota archaeon]|nr:AbiV family abortive infection protein [Nitrososphaerota archaeon]